MARQTIKQRIALDGAKEIEAELKELGKVGEAAFKKLQAAANNLKIGDDLITKLNRLQAQLGKVGTSFVDVGRKIKDAGRTLTTSITLPVVGAGVAILKMAGDFETAMNSFEAASGATIDQLGAVEDKALALGKSSVFSASEALGSMTELAKVGLSYEQIMAGAADATVKLAAANGAELTPAAALMGDVIAQFGLDVAKLGPIIDNITGGVNQSKLSFEDYVLAIGSAGGVASSLGVSFDDFNASIAATAKQFTSGQDAGTSFKTFLLRLTPSTVKATALFKKFNLEFFDAQGNFLGMANAAEELRTKLGGLSDEAKGIVLGELFGTDAIRTATALMDQGAEGLERMLKLLRETDAAQLAEVRMKGFNGALDTLKGSVEALSIVIGKSGFLQTMTELVDSFTGFINKLSETDPELLNFGVKIAAIAAAIGPLLIAVGLFTQGIGGLAFGLKAVIATVVLLITSIGRLSAVFLANPWLAAITLVAGGILTWATRTDEATTALEAHKVLVGEVEDAYAAAGGEVAKMSEEVKNNLFRETVKTLEDNAAAIQDTFDSIKGELFVARMSEAFGGLIQKFSDGKLGAQDFIEEVNEIVRLQPELAQAGTELVNVLQPLADLQKTQGFKTDFLKLLTGEMTDAEFQAKHLQDSLQFKPKVDVQPLEELGAATDKAKKKAEDLGNAVTVTKLGGTEGAIKSVHSLVDGVAQAAEESTDALEDVGEAADKTKDKLKGVSEEIKLSVVSVPEEMRSGASEIKAATDEIVTDIGKVPAAAEKAAEKVSVALDDIGQTDPAAADSTAVAILTAFESLAVKVKEVFAGLQEAIQASLQDMASKTTPSVNAIIADIERITPAAAAVALAANTSLASIGQIDAVAIQTVLDGILLSFQTLSIAVTEIFTNIQTLFTTSFTNIGISIVTAMDAIVAAIQNIAIVAEAAALATNTALATIGQVDATAIAATVEAMLAPFNDLAARVGEIFAEVQSIVISGFQNLADTINQIAVQIQNSINRIIAQLRAAAAEAARLRAQASAGGDGPSFSGGGSVFGKGTGTSDSIRAWLSAGEFVTRAKAVKYYGPELFRALNSMRLPKDFLKEARGFSLGGLASGLERSMGSISPAPPRLADGGLVQQATSRPAGRPFIFQFADTGEQFEFIDPDAVTEKFIRSAARHNMRSAGRKPAWYAGG